jgi:hypothetical protein
MKNYSVMNVVLSYRKKGGRGDPNSGWEFSRAEKLGTFGIIFWS